MINFYQDSEKTEKEYKKEFSLGKNYAKWILENKSKNENEFSPEKITKIAYRPFDIRYTYFDTDFIWRHRGKVTEHFLRGNNLGLLAKKGFPLDSFTAPLGFISNNISESRSWTSSGMQGIESSFPLYLYNETPDGFEKLPNLNPDVLKTIAGELGLVFDGGAAEHSRSEFSAENLLDYIYAVLHTPSYRETFREFLKIDFPKIPFDVSSEIFWQMVEQGTALRKLHLLESATVSKNLPIFHGTGNNIVDKKIKFEDEKVYINETQYFDGVSDIAWNFYIGGYQPAQKYLKDRRGRELGFDEIQNYQKMIVALSQTDVIMKKLDDIISFNDNTAGVEK
ncbi:MAG: type ISP restriction/modification enzyme [Minisyncoccia bacterium]